MHLSQKVALNTIIQIVTKIVTVCFGLATMILLTSSLGREGYGNYMYILTLVTIFGAFSDWGTATIGVREASRVKEKQDEILVNVFFIRLVLAFFGACLMIGLAFLLPLGISNYLLIRQGILLGSLILILFAIKASFGLIFQTKMQMQKLAVADILASALVFLISWIFIKMHLGLMALIGAILIANIVAVFTVGFLAVKTIRFHLKIDRQFIKNFLFESLPMGAVLLMFTVDNKIDTVMLGYLKGADAVGIYAVAYRVYDVLILGAAYLMSSLLPVISQYATKDDWRNKFKIIYQKSFDVLLIMGLIIFLFGFFGSPLIIRILTLNRFGEFFDTISILRILSFAIFLSYFNHLTGYTLVSLKKQNSYFFIAFSALVFNVVLNLIVIPYFSYWGAAMITVATEFLVLIATSIFIYKTIGVVPSLFGFPKTLMQLIKQKGKIF
ncbi:MAG: flippase [Candidatus Shapirobacteria bacterium]|nr:flippase [Candidatus Shapirobacteria bacterium]